MATTKTCEIEGCGNPHAGRGMCATHYWRWSKYGSPLHGGSIRKRHVKRVHQIFGRVPIGAEGCWEWQGSRDTTGYGRLAKRRGTNDSGLAHRAVWEFLFGPIPEGLSIDHICKNRSCVRPDHLRVVTHLENMQTRSHCSTCTCHNLGGQ